MSDDTRLHIVEQLADEFARRQREGELISIDTFVAQHPEHADVLRDFLEAQQIVNDLGRAKLPERLPVNSMVGRYRVVREIGSGGMGVVYLANDPQLGRNVAIKLLTREHREDGAWLSRFRREARLASALNHPNILTIHEIGESEGSPFIATEYVEGTTLLKELAQRRLSREEAIGIGVQLASAMTAAHAAGVIHRDLKPENVMLRKDGLLKVLDFGLAKSTPTSFWGASDSSAATVSQPGVVIGTAFYMSPEQARGHELDISTDVFSFGIILFLMLTGEHPFQGDSATDVMAAILNCAPKSIAACDASVPDELRRLTLSCLNKESKFRPTAAQLLSELQRFRDRTTATDTGIHEPVTNTDGDTTVIPSNQLATRHFEPSDASDIDQVRYARSGDVNIAWQALGNGPIDLVFVMGWVSHLEWFWREPSFAAFLRRLATFSRVLLFDKRGTGLSDKVPVNELPTLEQRMDDVRAVMDAAESDRAVLCGVSEGGPMCTLFAATYPQKTIALTMMGCYARRLWAEDYPWGPTAEQREVFLEEIGRSWGGPLGIEDRAPSKADDPKFRDWWASYLRMGASPGAAVALTKMNAQIDVRPILSNIQVPTLVIHRTGDRCLLVDEGRYMAERIPGAKFVELPGDDHLPFVGDAEAVLDEIEEFLTGKRHAPEVDRVLATALYISIEDLSMDAECESTAAKLTQFVAMVEREVELFRGSNLVASETSLRLTFDGPVRAVTAASAITDLANRLQIRVRSGAHTGACDIGHQALQGPAVEQAGMIAARAPVWSVIVSEAVMNLVSGSGLNFVKCGAVENSAHREALELYQLVR